MENHYQALTSASKLRGQYYTPAPLVRLILQALRLAPGDRIIDPSCGDGGFLRGAVEALAANLAPAERANAAEYWLDRLIGFDIDAAAVQEARAGLQQAFREHFGVDAPLGRFQIHTADALQHPSVGALLQSVDAPPLQPDERLLVVGNPPYVEAKRLAAQVKATLKARYPDALLGASDLYLYFVHACLGWLRPQDRLAFVLPNKLLVNANARQIRERLLDEQRLQALWLATQARLFGDAAVYPVVLFAGGRDAAPAAGIEVARLARGAAGEMQAGEVLRVDAALYRHTSARALFPPPEAPELQATLARLLASLPAGRLSDVLDIRWTVSFHQAGRRERYITREPPASGCRRKILGGTGFAGNAEVVRYRLTWRGWWIDYDAERLRAEGNPVPPLDLFAAPKIVICQNGRTLRAAYDAEGYVLKDTFLCGSLRASDHPLVRHPPALVGLLCSRAAHFFYSHVFYGGHVSGGYLHFLRSFLIDLPLGRWKDEQAETIAALAARRESAEDAGEQLDLEEAIERHVSAALGLAGAEHEAIAAWAAQDENWRLRERVRAPKAPA